MKFIKKTHESELVIVGAGFAGICAAIQAAREGVKVTLINDRGVLGGNSSAEIGVHINGANDGGQLNLNSREGGICSEIMLEYKYRTPVRTNQFVLDGVLLDFIDREKNITIFLNTCIDTAEVNEGIIRSVSGSQNTTETRWLFTGRWFVDNTGDGALGALAGAKFMQGREAKDTFNEKIAPDKADHYVLPSTLNFSTKDMGYKVPFIAPDFSFNIKDSDVIKRRNVKALGSQWYYEIGGEYDHVFDREAIIKDHKALIFGIWDYLKNSGDYPECDNYDFDYISTIPGTREYRRLVGDYILTENDIRDQTDYCDTVGHGGWNIDLHAIKGIFDEDIVNRHIYFDGAYKIPYRTGYSKNINNLFMCGRCMSCSHVAFGTTRVMGTLSTLAQAIGMAVSLCKKYDVNPRDIYKDHMKELQQKLLREDQLILGVKNEDQEDLAKQAIVTASSTRELALAEQKNIDVDKRLTTIPPQFRNSYKIDYKGVSDFKSLDSTLALSIPIYNAFNSLKIKARCSKDTTLKYQVYVPNVIENYGPDKLIYESDIDIEKSQLFSWTELPINIKVKESYVFVLLIENKDIDLAVGGDVLPTTAMFTSFRNNNPSNVNMSTLKMAERSWGRSSISICYKTVPIQAAYRPEHVINGYNRAYGQTNMWLSSEEDKGPELKLEWQQPVSISQLQVTFSIDTTKRFYTECYEQIFDLVAQDYCVYAEVEDQQIIIAEVKENFKKMNRLEFDRITTSKITFKFNRSLTGQVGVYEVRAY